MAKTGIKVRMIPAEKDLGSRVAEYLEQKKAQGVTRYTLDNHRRALTQFLAGYNGDIADIANLKKALNRFLGHKKNEHYNKQLQALRQFLDFCMEEDVISENPARSMKYKRHTVRVIDHDAKTIRAFLSVMNKKTFSGMRDYGFCLLILDTGARPNEVLQLRSNDVDLEKKQIFIREEYSKTRQPRTLPISVQVVHVIRKLLTVRPQTWNMDAPVFCSYSGRRLTTGNLQERFRTYSKESGINITPYSLRHVFSLGFVRNGGDPFALQKILGHEKLDMTRVYVNLVQADVTNAHTKASPLGDFLTESKRVVKIPRGNR